MFVQEDLRVMAFLKIKFKSKVMEELKRLQEEIIEEKFTFKEKKERVREILEYVERNQAKIKEMIESYGIKIEKINTRYARVLGYLIKIILKEKKIRLNEFFESIPTTPRKIAEYAKMKSCYQSFELEPLVLGIKVGRRLFYVMNEDKEELEDYLKKRKRIPLPF